MFEIANLEYAYGGTRALTVASWKAKQGEACLLHGQSGSGKSTLLHLLAGILRPQKGQLNVLGKDFSNIAASELDRFRGAQIGIVLQKLYLVNALTVLQNLMLVPFLSGAQHDTKDATALLSHLELSGKANAYPSELSQGQAQRVAIARAMMNRPKLVLADEPTSSLDDVNCERVAKLLIEQADAAGATLVVATHDNRLHKYFANRFEL